MLREQILHHVRRLRALIHGEALLASLQSATIARGSLQTPVWRPKRNVVSTTSSASAKHCRPRRPRACARNRDCRPARNGSAALPHQRGFRIGNRRQFFVTQFDQFAGILGLRATRATTAQTASPCQQARSTAIGCCGADLRPFRWVSTPTQGVITLASSGPGDDRDHPRGLLRLRVVDIDDAGMRIR